MNILGISALYHDSAAALIQDGEIVAAAQEERFSRSKNDADFPFQAIGYCLREAGISIRDVHHIAFYDQSQLTFERLLQTWFHAAPRGMDLFRAAAPVWLREKLDIPGFIREHLNYSGNIHIETHHGSHAASAFYPSPFSEAAIITCDGVGEWATASWGIGRGSQIELVRQLDFPDSLGLFYSAFTHFLGFKVNCDEYKIMGLAPYGRPRHVDTILSELIDLKADGSIRLNMDYFTYCTEPSMTGSKFEDLFQLPRRRPESPIEQAHMDLARSAQQVLEEAMSRTARHVREETGMRHACLAGGVALNCVANGRILAENIFDQLWIQPAAGDAGGALGAAFSVWHRVLGQPRSVRGTDAQKGSLLGPAFSDAQIEGFLKANGYPADLIADEGVLVDRIAGLIEDGQVVGWYQGRMEFGPRALGCRSILGDPRSPRMQSIINSKIKNRESFRPFAPSILREHVARFFDMRAESPYMLLVAPVIEQRRLPVPDGEEDLFGIEKLKVARSDVPAVTHVDHSARVQTVDPERNPRYHRLIEAFLRRTGFPLLINTSFNVRDEPMVCSPADAYQCFMKTDMDHLAMGNYVLDKSRQPRIAPALRPSRSTRGRGETFKLVILGGSTSQGWPYHPSVDIGKLAGHFLGWRVGSRAIEVINLGIAGQPSSGVVETLEQIPADADLVLLYCGHNEYWARYEYPPDLTKSRRRLCDTAVASPRQRARILAEYHENLATVIRHCARALVPLIISTTAVNEAGRFPNRSVLCNPSNASRAHELIRAHDLHRVRREIDAALACMDELLSVEPEFAAAHHYRGNCLRIKGDFAGAKRAYEMALAHDGFPTAATPEMNEIIRGLAREHGLRLFDAGQILTAAAHDGIVDYELMLDSIHPNLEGYSRLGHALAVHIVEVTGSQQSVPPFSMSDIETAFLLNTEKLVDAHLHVCMDLLHCSTMTWNGEPLLERAVDHCLKPAAALVPDHPGVLFHQFLAAAFRNRLDEAERHLQRALQRDEVDVLRRVRPTSHVKALLMSRYLERTGADALLSAHGIECPDRLSSRVPMQWIIAFHERFARSCEAVLMPLVFRMILTPSARILRALGRSFLQHEGSRDSHWVACPPRSRTPGPGREGVSRAIGRFLMTGKWHFIPVVVGLWPLRKAHLLRLDNRPSPLIYTVF